MGGLDVVHGGLGAEAEDAHEVDGVGGVPGLVEDPVLPESGRAEAELGEGGVHDGEGDRRAGVGGGGLLGDQQVGVAGEGPVAVSFAEPAGHERAGELVEVDGVPSGRAPDEEVAAGQVEVIE